MFWLVTVAVSLGKIVHTASAYSFGSQRHYVAVLVEVDVHRRIERGRDSDGTCVNTPAMPLFVLLAAHWMLMNDVITDIVLEGDDSSELRSFRHQLFKQLCLYFMISLIFIYLSSICEVHD